MSNHSHLCDKDEGVRFTAVSELSEKSLLSESVVQSLIDALCDENEDIRSLQSCFLFAGTADCVSTRSKAH